jgi:hypothetical protein
MRQPCPWKRGAAPNDNGMGKTKKWDDGMAEELAREHRKSFREPLLESVEYALELGMTKAEFLNEAEEMWDAAVEDPEVEA